MTQTYARIEVLEGELFNREQGRCDVYFSPWTSFAATIETYFDQHENATIKVSIVQMTEEEFEAICNGGTP